MSFFNPPRVDSSDNRVAFSDPGMLSNWGRRATTGMFHGSTAQGFEAIYKATQFPNHSDQMVSIEDQKKKFGLERATEEIPWITAAYLKQRNEDRAKQAEYYRAGNNYGRGFAGGAAELLGGFMDPVNYMTMRFAPLAVRSFGMKIAAGFGAGTIGKVVGAGLAEGLVGTAVMEPFVAASQLTLQKNYDWKDLGTALAMDATFGVGFGLAGKSLGKLLNGNNSLILDATDPFIRKPGLIALMKAKVFKITQPDFAKDKPALTLDALRKEAEFEGKLNTEYIEDRFLNKERRHKTELKYAAHIKIGSKVSHADDGIMKIVEDRVPMKRALTARDVADVIEDLGGSVKFKFRAEIEEAIQPRLRDYSGQIAQETIEAMKIRKTGLEDTDAGQEIDFEPMEGEVEALSSDPTMEKTETVDNYLQVSKDHMTPDFDAEVAKLEEHIGMELQNVPDNHPLKLYADDLEAMGKRLTDGDNLEVFWESMNGRAMKVHTPEQIKAMKESGTEHKMSILDCILDSTKPKIKAPPAKAGVARAPDKAEVQRKAKIEGKKKPKIEAKKKPKLTPDQLKESRARGVETRRKNREAHKAEVDALPSSKDAKAALLAKIQKEQQGDTIPISPKPLRTGEQMVKNSGTNIEVMVRSNMVARARAEGKPAPTEAAILKRIGEQQKETEARNKRLGPKK